MKFNLPSFRFLFRPDRGLLCVYRGKVEDEDVARGTHFLYIFPCALIRQTIRKQPTLTKKHYYQDQTTALDNNRTTHDNPRYLHLWKQGKLRHDSLKSNSWAYQDSFSSQEFHGVLCCSLHSQRMRESPKTISKFPLKLYLLWDTHDGIHWHMIAESIKYILKLWFQI